MFGWKFYFGSIRKYVSLFGTLFNDIYIDRIDQANGNTLKTILVPLSYGPKDRYLVRLQQNPDLLREINQVLPRMTFEIKSVEYDPARKLNTIGKNRLVGNTANSLSSQYNPVPYNFNIDLSILTRNADDATRIVEQILPFFKPEWTTSINLIPDMGITMDIPVILKSIQYQDTYEASFNDRYAIIWTLQFVLKGYLYGPISTSGVILQTNTNLYVPDTNTAAQGVGITPLAEGTSPISGLDMNGNPVNAFSSSVVSNSSGVYVSNTLVGIPVSEITANTNYGYITDFYANVGMNF
jgi:hypothetical protein